MLLARLLSCGRARTFAPNVDVSYCAKSSTRQRMTATRMSSPKPFPLNTAQDFFPPPPACIDSGPGTLKAVTDSERAQSRGRRWRP